MKYSFIREFSSEFSAEKMCHYLRVSRSGYYAWSNRPESTRSRENRLMLDEIKKIHADKHRKAYGSPRIHAVLKAKGFKCSENRVARLMNGKGIKAINRKRFKVTTNSKHKLPIADNVLNQDFSAGTINEVWTSDITYIWTKEGWLYLGVILDAFSRQIVGWSMSERIDRHLVTNAIKSAITRRQPKDKVIFHSDRGSQYASDDVRELLKEHKFVQSMSGTGNCYDNAITESFFGSLKAELVYFENYATREEARRSIFDYVEVFYNRARIHSALGYVSPADYELANAA